MTLEILTSDLLAPTRHGFFTRAGGASSGVFAGLNCSHGSSDQTEIVAINRARAARAMGAEEAQLVTARQVHSADVITVEAPGDAADRTADGLVTRRHDLVLGVLTADCQPVLFCDPGAGVVGAAHAGWRGARAGVLEAVLDAMEGIGAQRTRIRAVIGPALSQANYEVGIEFRDRFVGDDPANAAFFEDGAHGKAQFDLARYGLSRLRKAGIAECAWVGACTYADPARFFSYRRSVHRREADYGRLISMIRAPD